MTGAVNEVLAGWTHHPEPRPPVEPVLSALCQFCAASLSDLWADPV